MKKCLWLALLISLCSHAGEWEFVHEKKGVRVSRKKVEGSPVIAFRGEGEIAASIDRVAAVVFDLALAREWMQNLAESRIVRWIDEDTYIQYDRVATPPIIMKDRDFVSKVNVKVDPALKTIDFRFHAFDEPGLADSKNIRGELIHTTFSLSPSADKKSTHLRGEIHADPKGSVPHWLVNIFQKDWPVDTFEGLRRQVLKSDIQANEKFEKRIKILLSK